jgi:hypothetical protein
MSSRLRRIIDMGPGGVVSPGSAHDYRFHDNRAYFADTATPWVRMWADWPSLQPDPAYVPDDPDSPGYWRLQALDEQIQAACDDGVKVILMPYRFPLWANGTEALGAQRNTDAEISFDYWDRILPGAWRRYLDNGRDPARYNPSRRALEYRIPPEGVGVDSAWGRFFAFLYARYHRGRSSRGWVDGFELVNEPNWQLWPQRGPSPTDDPFALGEPTVQYTMAQFMQTAQVVSADYGHNTLLLAPSTADSDEITRVVTRFDVFSAALLDALDASGYTAPDNQAWAHHNYLDIEQRVSETRTQAIRRLLDGRWTGYAEDGVASVFITEGGVRISQMRAYYPAEDPLEAQARSVREGWDRHYSDEAAGAGVAMLAQYQTYTDPHFDSGLLDPWPSTGKRPIYGVWASLPSHA